MAEEPFEAIDDPRVACGPAERQQIGAILQLVNQPIGNVSLVSSIRGSTRGDHYHMRDWHYIYVMTGELSYYFRPAGSTDAPAQVQVRTSEMIFTPPMVEHKLVFTADTLLLVMSGFPEPSSGDAPDAVDVVMQVPVSEESA